MVIDRGRYLVRASLADGLPSSLRQAYDSLSPVERAVYFVLLTASNVDDPAMIFDPKTGISKPMCVETAEQMLIFMGISREELEAADAAVRKAIGTRGP